MTIEPKNRCTAEVVKRRRVYRCGVEEGTCSFAVSAEYPKPCRFQTFYPPCMVFVCDNTLAKDEADKHSPLPPHYRELDGCNNCAFHCKGSRPWGWCTKHETRREEGEL